MKIADLFETQVEETIDPVIQVGERNDERKLAAEIGSYVVTPLIEAYLDDLLEHYTGTFQQPTTEIGVWVSGAFGSGKSHFAKLVSLLLGNPVLTGHVAISLREMSQLRTGTGTASAHLAERDGYATTCRRFETRLPPDSPRRVSLLRSLRRVPECATDVLAFNPNTLSDSHSRPLPALLLSQYYASRGYSGNLIYARVIEAELDRQGKLPALHQAVETRAKTTWSEVRNNLTFFRPHLLAAACEVAPDVFGSPQDVEQALQEAERGELYHVGFFIDTVLADLERRQAETQRPQRLLLVLDEAGQWIADDAGRLAQLQALVEEAAVRGRGRLWIVVTTHGDMGSIFHDARARAGDMKKIEGRFRFKFALTAENIERVLEDRLLRKTPDGKRALEDLFESRGSGLLRGSGELAQVTSRSLPACTRESFAACYPFFPYQVSLIPEIVKALRSQGGRDASLSGSTRTLLAIAQDILRAGRRPYLKAGLGALVSFDELYGNLAGEGEIRPEVRTELSRVRDHVPGASPLTSRVAEVLYLIGQLPFVPRTRDNLARLLVESVDDDLPAVMARIEPELSRLMAAGLVARTGEAYEFLTGEQRTFEAAVARLAQEHLPHDRDRGLKEHFVQESGRHPWRRWLESDAVSYHDHDFRVRLVVDDLAVSGTHGDVTLRLYSPRCHGRETLEDLESRSLRPDEQATLFFLSGRVPAFEQDLSRYLAMKAVIGRWKGDPQQSDDARKLASDREQRDLPQLERQVLEGLKEGLRTGRLVFRGSSSPLGVKPGQTPAGALRSEMAAAWPTLYPKFGKVPVRILDDQQAIEAILAGETSTAKDVAALRLFDPAGRIDPHSPLVDAIRIYLATEQAKRAMRIRGSDLLSHLCGLGYGWDANAVRVGVAALVRAGTLKIVVGAKEFTSPADRDLRDTLQSARQFDKAELVLQDTDLDPEVLTETRRFLMQLAKKRGIDETPAALSEAAESLATAVLAQGERVRLWADGADLPLPAAFGDGVDAWQQIRELTNPVHRVIELHAARTTLSAGHESIDRHAAFQVQHAAPFKELRELARQLTAIEHRLDADSTSAALLADFRAAMSARSFANQVVWNALQVRKGQTLLELATLLDGWRQEARSTIATALARLPAELAARQLDPGLEAALAAPLISLRENLDAATLPSQVAAFPDQARRLVRDLGRRIAHETAPSAPRPVRVVRARDVAAVTRITTPQEWKLFQAQLDQHVQRLLAEGFEVELESEP